MRCVTLCVKCRGKNLKYLSQDHWYCNDCQQETETATKYIESPFERQERAVYSTGNRWAIENWKATHY